MEDPYSTADFFCTLLASTQLYAKPFMYASNGFSFSYSF